MEGIRFFLFLYVDISEHSEQGESLKSRKPALLAEKSFTDP
jgi:hypothetical protein